MKRYSFRGVLNTFVYAAGDGRALRRRLLLEKQSVKRISSKVITTDLDSSINHYRLCGKYLIFVKFAKHMQDLTERFCFR